MPSRTRALVVGSLAVLAPAVALAATQVVSFRGYFKEIALNLADVTPTVGAKRTTGFQLPTNIVAAPFGGQSFPVCVSWYSYSSTATSGSGWVGLGTSRQVGSILRLDCNTHDRSGRDRDSWVFKNDPQRPYMWIRSIASVPEPRGAIKLAVQEISGRPLYACAINKGGSDYLGYIGDDGNCYGVSTSGSKASDSTYQVLVSEGTGTAAQPRYEWMPGTASYVPHPHAALGQLTAKANINGIVLVSPPKKTLCKVLDGGSSWPGYLEGSSGTNSTCRYYTYFNNQTVEKTSHRYSVRRVDPAAAKSRYVFGNHGGKSYYACVGANNVNSIVWGFSNNLTGCTNGTTTVTQNVVYAELPADPPSGA